jgi:hypothetical protein
MATRLSDDAANVSWQFMLLKEEPTLREATRCEALRVCDALEIARDVVTNEAPVSEDLGHIGRDTKRRLIEDRQVVGPVMDRIVKLLPSVRSALAFEEYSIKQIEFLQNEFASLSLVLQDRGL